MARLIGEKEDAIPAIAEVFREHGFEGASLALISKATGFGKGSLYYFFPGGKDEMALAVMAHVESWFEAGIFAPLREDEPRAAIPRMLRGVDCYFRSGRRVCLIGVFALGESRDRFPDPIHAYFHRWIEALGLCLERGGMEAAAARQKAEAAVLAIQGALVLARGLRDDAVFARALHRVAVDLGEAWGCG